MGQRNRCQRATSTNRPDGDPDSTGAPAPFNGVGRAIVHYGKQREPARGAGGDRNATVGVIERAATRAAGDRGSVSTGGPRRRSKKLGGACGPEGQGGDGDALRDRATARPTDRGASSRAGPASPGPSVTTSAIAPEASRIRIRRRWALTETTPSRPEVRRPPSEATVHKAETGGTASAPGNRVGWSWPATALRAPSDQRPFYAHAPRPTRAGGKLPPA